MNNLEVLDEVTSTKSNELNYKIYCDMDGVLTDFDKQFTDSILGVRKSLKKKTVEKSFGGLLMEVELDFG